MTAEFKGYALFDDVGEPTLRAWNRCNLIQNIREAHGEELAKEYIAQFGKHDQVAITMIFIKVHQQGYEKTRMEIQEIANGLEAA